MEHEGTYSEGTRGVQDSEEDVREGWPDRGQEELCEFDPRRAQGSGTKSSSGAMVKGRREGMRLPSQAHRLCLQGTLVGTASFAFHNPLRLV